ncbi:hypothetical protein D9619_009459 [Psilocybe cf. subviscida]|uniref:Uncharacterized protein n=1 Tax=Psilocybe cf. subviscida TaxID=2480587 RepID=A0A8H5FA42_9AGAR|nr:hypothetical protein D9619_009459 [Psilocybe cf. subviscida]
MFRIPQSLASNTKRLTQTTRRSWLHTTASLSAKSHESGGSKPKHTPDTYSRDVDTSSAPDTSVHRVDPSNNDVQKPHEPPSGEWSRAGVESEEYRHMEGGKDAKGGKEPYAPAGGSKGAYGSKQGWKEEKGPETSNPGEGPEGGSAAGRK